MTTTELTLKARRFTAKMSVTELRKTHAIIEEMIEDAIDARDAARISKRIREGKEKTFTHEEVKAMLDKKFAA
jgi:predicted DNA-binding protein